VQQPAGDDAVAAELGLKDEDELMEPTVDAEVMIEETVEEVEERGVKREAETESDVGAKKQKTEVPFDEEAEFNA
jgi:hypothetical protein